MTLNFEEYKTKLYSAVLADTLDSLGYHKQTLTPGIKSIKPDVIICGLARVGLYMPIYHDDENTNVYEHEIALIDSLKENEIAVLCCHGNEKIAPWGELLSTRATYLKSAGCLTDGCVRDTKMINEIGFPVFAKGTNPVDTKFRGKMMMADVPGEIANVYVESGDLVFGDNDGVVVVPSKVIDEVIKKALENQDADYSEIINGDSLKGFSGLLFSNQSPSSPAKVIKEFRKSSDSELPSLKVASIESDIFTGDNHLDSLSKLKGKEEIIGDIVLLLQSPAKNIISLLKSSENKISGVVKALGDKQE